MRRTDMRKERSGFRISMLVLNAGKYAPHGYKEGAKRIPNKRARLKNVFSYDRIETIQIVLK